MDWDDYPVILGFGSTHEMRDNDEPAPRLWNMKSVSAAAARALAKPNARQKRQVGFATRRP